MQRPRPHIGAIGAAAIAMGGCALITSFDVEDETANGESGGGGAPLDIPCTAPADCPSDGVFCNGEESCVEGVCIAAGDPCDGADDDDDCSEQCDEESDSCDGLDPDGTACNDGSFCNGADSCQAGSCSAHGGNPCPSANGDGNCSESCDENADSCTAPDPDGSPCDDALFCNGVDWCLAGSCSAHGPPPCDGPDDLDSDCWESCREEYDDCHGMDPNGSSCWLDEPSCCMNGGCSPLAC